MRKLRGTGRPARGRTDMNLRPALAAVALTLLVGAPPAAADPYSFTRIADSTNSLDFLGHENVNSSGTAIFRASPPRGGPTTFYSGSGGPLTTVANYSGPFSGFGVADINDAGTAVFNAALDAGGNGIFTRTGLGPFATVDDASGPRNSFFYSRISPAG